MAVTVCSMTWYVPLFIHTGVRPTDDRPIDESPVTLNGPEDSTTYGPIWNNIISVQLKDCFMYMPCDLSLTSHDMTHEWGW